MLLNIFIQSYSLTDFCEEEFWFLISCFAIELIRKRLPNLGCFNLSVVAKKKCLFLHKYFLFWRNGKDIPTPKTMVIYLYCSCIVSFLESVKIVSHYKVHKRPKTVVHGVAFETSFFACKALMGTPLFIGNNYQRARFCNDDIICK